MCCKTREWGGGGGGGGERGDALLDIIAQGLKNLKETEI